MRYAIENLQTSGRATAAVHGSHSCQLLVHVRKCNWRQSLLSVASPLTSWLCDVSCYRGDRSPWWKSPHMQLWCWFTYPAQIRGWGAVSGIPYPLIRLFRTVVSGFETRLNLVLKVREQKSEKRLRDCLGGEHVHSRQNETFEAPDHGESLGLAHMSFCCCVLGVDTCVSGYTKTAGIPNARNHYILCDWCW